MAKGVTKISKLEHSDVLLINKYTGDIFQSDIKFDKNQNPMMALHNTDGKIEWHKFSADDYVKVDLTENYKNLELGDYLKHGQCSDFVDGIVKQVYDCSLREVYEFDGYNHDSYKDIKADYLNLQNELREINSEISSEFSKKNKKGDAEYMKLYAKKVYEILSKPRVCDIARDVFVYKAVKDNGMTTEAALKEYNIQKEGNEIIEIKAKAQSEFEVAKSNYDAASTEISSYKHYGAVDQRNLLDSFAIPGVMRILGRGLSILPGVDYESFKKRYPIGASVAQYQFIKQNIDHFKATKKEYEEKKRELEKVNNSNAEVEKKYRPELKEIEKDLKGLINESKEMLNDIEKVKDEKIEIIEKINNETNPDKKEKLNDDLKKCESKLSELNNKRKEIEKKQSNLIEKTSKVQDKMKIELRNKVEKNHKEKENARIEYVKNKDNVDKLQEKVDSLSKKAKDNPDNKNLSKELEKSNKELEAAKTKLAKSEDKLNEVKARIPNEVECEMIRGSKSENDKSESKEDSNEKVENKSSSESKEDAVKDEKNEDKKESDKNEDANKPNDKKDSNSNANNPDDNNKNESGESNVDNLDLDTLEKSIEEKIKEKDKLESKVKNLENQIEKKLARLDAAEKSIAESDKPSEKQEKLVKNIKEDLYGKDGLYVKYDSVKKEFVSLTDSLKTDLEKAGKAVESANEKKIDGQSQDKVSKPFNSDFIDNFLKRYDNFLSDKTKSSLLELKSSFETLNDKLNDIGEKLEEKNDNSIEKPTESADVDNTDSNNDNAESDNQESDKKEVDNQEAEVKPDEIPDEIDADTIEQLEQAEAEAADEFNIDEWVEAPQGDIQKEKLDSSEGQNQNEIPNELNQQDKPVSSIEYTNPEGSIETASISFNDKGIDITVNDADGNSEVYGANDIDDMPNEVLELIKTIGTEKFNNGEISADAFKNTVEVASNTLESRVLEQAEVLESNRIDSILNNVDLTDFEKAILIVSGESDYKNVELNSINQLASDNPDAMENAYKMIENYKMEHADDYEKIANELNDSNVDATPDENVNAANQDSIDDKSEVITKTMSKYEIQYKDLPIDFSEIKTAKDLKNVCKFGDFFLKHEKYNINVAGLNRIDAKGVSIVEMKDGETMEFAFLKNDYSDKINVISLAGSEYAFETSKPMIDNRLSDKHYEGSMSDYVFNRLDSSGMALTNIYKIDAEGNMTKLDFKSIDASEKQDIINSLGVMIENQEKAEELIENSDLFEKVENSDDVEKQDESENNENIEEADNVNDNDDQIFDEVESDNIDLTPEEIEELEQASQEYQDDIDSLIEMPDDNNDDYDDYDDPVE